MKYVLLSSVFFLEPICYMGKNKICLVAEYYKRSDLKLRKQIISFLNVFLHENYADERSGQNILVMNPNFKDKMYKTIIEIPKEATSASVHKLINCLRHLATSG